MKLTNSKKTKLKVQDNNGKITEDYLPKTIYLSKEDMTAIKMLSDYRGKNATKLLRCWISTCIAKEKETIIKELQTT